MDITMKRQIRHALGVGLLSSLLSTGLCAEPSAPGYIDWGKFSPPASGGEFIEVNLGQGLISMTARLVANSEPEIGDLIRAVQRIRVNVIGLDDQNRAEMQERVKTLRAELDTGGWERLVTVQEKGQDVGVYVKTRGDEAVQGLAVTVLEGKKEAVFVNIVGDLKPEKLALIGERFNIEPLKKIGVVAKH